MYKMHEFRPDWISPPGDTIHDLLHERNLSADWLVGAIGTTEDTISELLNGQAPITSALAQSLHAVFGASVQFWLNRDEMYRAALQEQDETRQMLLKEFPDAEMSQNAWIQPFNGAQQRLTQILDYFGVESIGSWQYKYGSIEHQYAFRTSLAYTSTQVVVAAWLRQGEKIAERVTCADWNPDGMRAALPHLKALTRQKDPQSFLPQLQVLCAEQGVALVALPPLTGNRISGATRMLSSRKSVILLSARYLSDDHFWFTFFHEVGHLLLHGSDEMFLDFSHDQEEIGDLTHEVQANDFARDVLIPEEFREELSRLKLSHKTLIRFAARVGVSPGIVVGQLQHSKRVPHHWFNDLKRRYRWNGPNLRLT